MHAGLSNRHRPEARKNLSLRQIAVANDLATALVIDQMRMALDVIIHLGLNGLDQHTPCAGMENLAEHVPRRFNWKAKRFSGTFRHGWCLLVLFSKHQGAPPLLFSQLIHDF